MTYDFNQLEPETQQSIKVAIETGSTICMCYPHRDTENHWNVCEYHRGYDKAVEMLKGHTTEDDPE